MRNKVAKVAFGSLVVGIIYVLYTTYVFSTPSYYTKFAKGRNGRRVFLPVIKDPNGEQFPLGDELMNQKIYSIYHMRTFTDSYNENRDVSSDSPLAESEMCKKIQFQGRFKVSHEILVEADYERFIEEINRNEYYFNLLDRAHRWHKSNIPEKYRWLRFGGSSIWLEEFNVHYMVSRILYSPSGIPNKAFASFLYVQLFDKDGHELTDVSLNIPYNTDQMSNNDKANSINKDSSDIKHKLQNFPSILPIKFDSKLTLINGKYYWGPEDPRIIAKKSPSGHTEPLIVFNMKSLKHRRRLMHSYLPFSNSLNILDVKDRKLKSLEKNWIPFISQSANTNNNNIINFVYSMDPLEILKCDINTGVCEFLESLKDKNNFVGPLRGGTQLISLPFNELIPENIRSKYQLPKNRQIYLGWARTHLNNCGCGESMYRPNLIILVEDFNPETKKYYYKISEVSEYVDFKVKVPLWPVPKVDKDGNLIPTTVKKCDGRSVLIPNSIAFWKIFSLQRNGVIYKSEDFASISTLLNEEINSLVFNDYMGVTLSAADSNVSIVYLKGILNYILSISSIFDPANVVSSDDELQQSGHDWNLKCSLLASREYCEMYGEEHDKIISIKP